MAKRRRGRPKRWGRKGVLALILIGVLFAIGFVLGFGIQRDESPRPPAPEDRPAIEVAERFLNHWTRFEYGKALLVSTGETRRRVLEAMDKELALDGPELETAAALRASVENLRMEIVVHSVQDTDDDEKVLRVTALAHEADQVFERDQVFHLLDEGGWKVAAWDTGIHPEDRRR